MSGTAPRRIGATRLRVLAEARAWIGTPFRHQARLAGVGVDCANLVIAAGEAAGVLAINEAAWRPFAGYGRQPNPNRMGAALATFLAPLEAGRERPGDVAWLQWARDLPMHLAVLGALPDRRLTLIHALESAGRVVEHDFTAEWPGRVVSWWRFPGLVRRG